MYRIGYRVRFYGSAIVVGLLAGACLSSMQTLFLFLLCIGVVQIQHRNATGYVGIFGPAIDTIWIIIATSLAGGVSFITMGLQH